MRKRFSIQNKMVMIMVSLAMLPVLVMGCICARQSENIVIDKVNSLCSKNLEIASWQFKAKFDVILSTLQQIPKNQIVLEAAEKEAYSEEAFNVFQNQIHQELYDPTYLLSLSNPFIYALIFKNGNCYTSHDYAGIDNNAVVQQRLEEQDWYQKLKNSRYSQHSLQIGENVLYSSGGEQVYFASNIMVDNHNEGVAVIGISKYYLCQMLRHFKMTSGSYLNLTTRSGDIWLSSDGEPMNLDVGEISNGTKVLWREEEYLLWHSSIDTYGSGESWDLHMLVPISDYYEDASQLVKLTVFMVLVTCVLIVLMIMYTRRWLLQPIMRLSDGMNRVQRGDMTTQVAITTEDELGDLCAGFNTMVKTIDASVHQIKSDEQKKHDLELRILQEQINPHFVKNTLTTIRRMADMKGAMGISRALGAFISMVEYSFHRSDPIVKLKDELAYLEQFIYLQKIRYQNMFDYETNIPEELLDAQLPKMILQPIVENSVLHGVVEKEGGGKIRIDAETQNDELWLHIWDNGVGMTKEQVAGIMERMEEDPRTRKNVHIGLQNVRSRLHMIYGARHDIQIDSQPDVYSHILLRIPLQFDGGDLHGKHENCID